MSLDREVCSKGGMVHLSLNARFSVSNLVDTTRGTTQGASSAQAQICICSSVGKFENKLNKTGTWEWGGFAGVSK